MKSVKADVNERLLTLCEEAGMKWVPLVIYAVLKPQSWAFKDDTGEEDNTGEEDGTEADMGDTGEEDNDDDDDDDDEGTNFVKSHPPHLWPQAQDDVNKFFSLKRGKELRDVFDVFMNVL